LHQALTRKKHTHLTPLLSQAIQRIGTTNEQF